MRATNNQKGRSLCWEFSALGGCTEGERACLWCVLPGTATSPSQRTVMLQYLFDCPSAYDQPRQVGIKSPNPGTPIQSPLQQFPRQDRSFLTPAGPPHPTSSCGYLNENRWVTARRRQPLARKIALLGDSGRKSCSIQNKVLSFQQSQDLPHPKYLGPTTAA